MGKKSGFLMFCLLCCLCLIMIPGQIVFGDDTIDPPPGGEGDEINYLVATPSSGAAPLIVNLVLHNLALRARVVSWDFGDGSPLLEDSSLSQTHTYQNIGSYCATVTIATRISRFAEVYSESTVGVTVTQANNPPTVSLTATRNSGTAPMLAGFTAAASDPDNDSLTYRWDFGDGIIETGTADNSHWYYNAGIYVTKVTVNDGRGGVAEASQTITVNVPSPPVIYSFTVNPASGIAPLPVSFSVTDSASYGDNPAYRWDFGDGTTANTGQVPYTSHTYQNPGIYSATVTVSTLTGTARQTKTVAVQANQPPQITGLTISPSNNPCPAEVNFSVTASDPNGEPLSYYWSFGDNTSAQGPTVSHTYSRIGRYSVSVQVQDGHNGSAFRTAFFDCCGLIGTYTPQYSGAAFRSKIIGDYYYVCNYNVFQILNISNNNPVVAGTIFDNPSPFFTSFDIQSNILYLAGQQKPLRVYNIGNPAAPQLLGATGNNYSINDIKVAGQYAYGLEYGNPSGFLVIFDISNPSTPVQVGRCNLDAAGYTQEDGIIVEGDYAYIGLSNPEVYYSKTRCLRIVNISNRSNPQIVGRFGVSGTSSFGIANQIAKKGNYIYLADNDKVHLINVSNPATLWETYGIFNETGQKIRDLEVAGDILFVAYSGGIFEKYNVADPGYPRRIYTMTPNPLSGNGDFERIDYRVGGYLYYFDLAKIDIYYVSDQL